MGKNKESSRKPSGYRFSSDTLKLTPGYNIISQSIYPVYTVKHPYTGELYDAGSDFSNNRGRVIYNTPTQADTVYFNIQDDWVDLDKDKLDSFQYVKNVFDELYHNFD